MAASGVVGFNDHNRHGVEVFHFATVSGCDQLVVGPTHARGGTLDLLMIDVPDLERVAIVATRITPLFWRSFQWLRLFQTCLLVSFLETPS